MSQHLLYFLLIDLFQQHLFNQVMLLSTQKKIEIYIVEIFIFHGVPSRILSDKDMKSTSHSEGALHEALRMRPRLSSTYHSQTDRQIERTNQSFEDLL